MWNTLGRLSAAAAIIGGALWIVYAVLAAGKPPGCAGDECLLQSHRDLGGLEALVIAGGLLLLFAVAQLAARVRGVSAAAVAAGVAAILAGIATGNWYVFVAGVAACVVGSAVLGIALIRAGAAPAWVGALLVAGSLALFAANDQDDRVLFVIPFALAWMVAGAYGLRRPRTVLMAAG
jgi:hypothetical protein